MTAPFTTAAGVRSRRIPRASFISSFISSFGSSSISSLRAHSCSPLLTSVHLCSPLKQRPTPEQNHLSMAESPTPMLKPRPNHLSMVSGSGSALILRDRQRLQRRLRHRGKVRRRSRNLPARQPVLLISSITQSPLRSHRTLPIALSVPLQRKPVSPGAFAPLQRHG